MHCMLSDILLADDPGLAFGFNSKFNCGPRYPATTPADVFPYERRRSSMASVIPVGTVAVRTTRGLTSGLF